MVDEHETIEADFSVFFSMLAIINITAQPFSKLFEIRYDISLNEWRIMHVLALYPDCSQTAVVNAIGLDKMTVSRAVTRLEQEGRIDKIVDPANLRAARLRLSEKGRDLHNLIAESGEARARELFYGFTKAERRMFKDLIRRMLFNAQQMCGDDSAE